MSRSWMILAAALVVGSPVLAGPDEEIATLQGDWQGTWAPANAAAKPLVAQLLALGDGKVQVNLLEKFDTRDPALAVLQGEWQEGKIATSGKAGAGPWEGADVSATFAAKTEGAEGPACQGVVKKQDAELGTFKLARVVRLSPTMGAKPPEGAIVLFDGKNLDQIVHRNDQPCRWKLLEDGAVEVTRGTGGITTKPKFTDHKLHVEFRTPYEPKNRGQGRGNSGVYLQGRYEVQVLDSYALAGEHNECGGIYSVAKPRVNMCAPPLQWQTYDITFTAPRFDADGNKAKSARMTVLHNGVEIHKDVEVPKPTTACWDQEIKVPGGLHLQDHGNPVQYRNLWAVEIKAGEM